MPVYATAMHTHIMLRVRTIPQIIANITTISLRRREHKTAGTETSVVLSFTGTQVKKNTTPSVACCGATQDRFRRRRRMRSAGAEGHTRAGAASDATRPNHRRSADTPPRPRKPSRVTLGTPSGPAPDGTRSQRPAREALRITTGPPHQASEECLQRRLHDTLFTFVPAERVAPHASEHRLPRL